MQLSPRIKKFLDMLGINTTRLQWKLYKLKQRTQRMKGGPRLPASLQWLSYEHKFCLKCNALAARDERKCRRCGSRLPSLLGYRIYRMLGVTTPGGSITVSSFLGLIAFFFALGMLRDGPSVLMSPSNELFDMFGGFSSEALQRGPEYWRALSFGLIHIGLMHIGFNCFALMQVGPFVENEIGRTRMLVLITFTQLTCAAASYWWYVYGGGTGQFATAGASGWLFGLIGFAFGYDRLSAHRSFFTRWMIYGLLFGFMIGANNAAHVGGLIGGFLLAKIPEPTDPRKPYMATLWNTAAGLSATLWGVTLAFMAHSIITRW